MTDITPLPLFTTQLVAGSVIASMGFMNNSETTVIGAMLISPIGKFIIDSTKRQPRALITFRDENGNFKLRSQWFSSNAAKLWRVLVLPIVIGAVGGLVDVKTRAPDQRNHPKHFGVLRARGSAVTTKDFVCSAVVVVAAAFIFTSGDTTPVIGTGIATALLPPLVAAGYYLGYNLGNCSSNGVFGWRDVGVALGLFLLNAAILKVAVKISCYARKGSCSKSQ